MCNKHNLSALALALLLLLAASFARAYEPTSNYESRQMEGWTVLVNKQLLSTNAAVAKEVLQVLDQQLFQIARVVPQPALARLRDVTIWVEASDPLFPCACYHPSGGWVRQHGLNPEKATCVEIANPRNFLDWTKDQPWMILHELAHSYHHRVLGFDNPEIKEAYKQAVASKTYDSVLYIHGQMMRHYALTDEKEYFAESSEAFFGCNDFYPFTRAELQQHDPTIYALMVKLWGVKPAAHAPVQETEKEASSRTQ